jgi:hypothetical protein
MSDAPPKAESRYSAIVDRIFFSHWKKGAKEFHFDREEIETASRDLGIVPPKNLGDVVYTFRYRRPLSPKILATQPRDRSWLILGAGDAKYRFRLNRLTHIDPTRGLLVRKIPDATPEIISQYALNDEQALLARVRYNRLVDIFLGIIAASLQNHLRTKIANYGQIEIDELYVGIDTRGAQYIVPVQAKGGNDRLGVIQTIQDVAFCQEKERYRHCVPRPVSCQFMPDVDGDTVIAMFELNFDGNEVAIVQERHYRLTAAKQISPDDLNRYRQEAAV